MELDRYCEAAERAARQAGGILRQMAGKVSVQEKGRSDLVTSADFASQEAIRSALLAEFPDHAFLGEESKGPIEERDYRWIVDPLDGTSNYVHGVEFYCVSIGLEMRGELIVGVIYDPCADRLFSAKAGGGAFLNGKAIQVSHVSSLRESLLVTGFPPGMRGRTDLLGLFEAFCAECHSVRRTGSAALDLAYVACGRFEGFYSTNLNCWDAAAGVVIVREAGGLVTNLDGTPYDLYTPDLLATNGQIHGPVIDIAVRFRQKT